MYYKPRKNQPVPYSLIVFSGGRAENIIVNGTFIEIIKIVPLNPTFSAKKQLHHISAS